MMLFRAKELFEGSSELLKAEAELAGTRLRRVLVRSLIAMVLGLFVLIGMMFLIAGTTVLLAREAGWPVSLLAHGAVLLTITLCVWFWHARTDPGEGIESAITEDDTEEEAMEDKQDAKEQMSEAVHGDQQDDDSGSMPSFDKIKDEALDFAIKNPTVVAGAGMLVISALGPGRSLRLLAKGVTAAGLIKSAIGAVTDGSDDGANGPKESASNTTHPRGQHLNQTNGTAYGRVGSEG